MSYTRNGLDYYSTGYQKVKPYFRFFKIFYGSVGVSAAASVSSSVGATYSPAAAG